MLVIDDLGQSQPCLARPLVFVPTMGALHQGHAALIAKAREVSNSVLVSDFINPLQFEDQSDLAKYPRTPARDIEIAQASGATAIWFPKVEEIYPSDNSTVEPISPGPVGDLYEGAARNGHFSGVLTVVNRLFSLVEPTWAVFGEKDFQQLFLIRQMVKSRNLPILILAIETVRDLDGLAISSRNVRLSPAERLQALVVPRALNCAAKENSLAAMENSLLTTLRSEPNFTLDYAVIIDEQSLDIAHPQTLRKRALVAGWVNGVRLLDNMSMNGAAL